MNNMTIEEQKIAVCSKLPELIYTYYNPPMFHWRFGERSGKDIHWPTEGLQICHEAEKLLTQEQIRKYVKELYDLQSGQEIENVLHTTYEQRLEALCRIWYPERFSK